MSWTDRIRKSIADWILWQSMAVVAWIWHPSAPKVCGMAMTITPGVGLEFNDSGTSTHAIGTRLMYLNDEEYSKAWQDIPPDFHGRDIWRKVRV